MGFPLKRSLTSLVAKMPVIAAPKGSADATRAERVVRIRRVVIVPDPLGRLGCFLKIVFLLSIGKDS